MNSNGTNLRSDSIFVSFRNNIRENVSWEPLKLGLISGYKGTELEQGVHSSNIVPKRLAERA